MEKIKLNKMNTGINFGNNTYMVAGYLSDYKLTYLEDSEGLTVKDLEENKGYVDDSGAVHIFRENPGKLEKVPWFTVVMNSDGKPVYKYNPKRTPEMEKAFRLENVRDWSVVKIMEETDPNMKLFDEDTRNALLSTGSQFVPVIKDFDDFLKKLIKTTLIQKDCDIHEYRGQFANGYQLSNLIQALNGTTKTGPLVFASVMDVLGCEFEIIVRDNKKDRRHPLDKEIHYDSRRNTISICESKEKGGSNNNANVETKMPRSAKQFN